MKEWESPDRPSQVLIFALQALLFLLLLFAVTALSYGAEPTTITLDQAVAQALAANPGLKAADAQVAAADADMQKTWSGFLPKVTLSETWSRTDSPLMVLGTKLNRQMVTPADFDPAVMNDPRPISNYDTRLAVMQPIWNGGKGHIARSQAKLGKEASTQDRERSRQEIVARVVKAYYGLLLAGEYRKVALQSLETSQANVTLAQARYKAGAVLRSDLLRAKVQLAEVQEMVTRAENNLALGSAGLAFAMGAPQGTQYEPAGGLAIQERPADLDVLLGRAMAERPDLLSMDLNRRNAEKSVTMARTGYLPTLNLMGQTDWNSDRVGGEDSRSWSVMAVAQWNLFDGLATRSSVNAALAQKSRMQFLEEQTRAMVELQVRQAYYDLSASLDRITATTSSVQEAAEGLRIVQKRYETGMTTFVDVLGAENALIRARTNALQALYDNNIARAELNLAMGTL